MVVVSHGRLERVRELLDARPALARAAVDWGYGDWEDALGAASHIGHREIAELLIEHGARPTIFSSAMLGQLEVVKAFVEASPGVQRIPGPHGISLLDHARAGRERAKPIYDYLVALGDAGGPSLTELSKEQIDSLLGTYVFGEGPNDRFIVALDRNLLMLKRGAGDGRPLKHTGDLAFYPAGSNAVSVRFARAGAQRTLTIHDAELVVTARLAP
jgi:hypothetical protein